MRKQTYQHEKVGNGHRGQLGLDYVKGTMIILLVLAVIAIVMFTGLSAIIGSSSSLATRTIGGNSFSNQTFTLNSTGGTVSPVVGLTSPSLASIIVTNRTSGGIVQSANYSEASGVFTALTNSYNNSVVNISATYSYTVPGDAVNVQNNITNGATNFFLNVPTVFTILGAVIIIAAVGLILVAVRRYGASAGASL